jgi:TetR/AcrR family transcriptional regulator
LSAAGGPTPRRGRPRTNGRSSDLDAREEILRSAAALFSHQGIGATRITDIAAAVGVTPPSIYYYFDNLDAIVETLLDYVVVESLAFATSVSAQPGDAAERLRQLVAQHVERLILGPYDLWFVAGLTARDSARFPMVRRRAHGWRSAVAGLVREGVAVGSFADIEPEIAVAAISGLVYGALELHHRGTQVHPAQIATLAVRALSSPPDPEREQP